MFCISFFLLESSRFCKVSCFFPCQRVADCLGLLRTNYVGLGVSDGIETR